MYIVLSFTAIVVLILLTMFAAFCIVAYFTRKKMTINKEEKLWERLKENRQDTFKNSSQ